MYFVIALIAVMLINYPVINFIGKLKNNTQCSCAHGWKLEYLYYFILFWYSSTSLQILLLFLAPQTFDMYTDTILYYPSVVISGVSYTFYIMILWSYVEYLKEADCHCSNIIEQKYVSTYSWFFFLLYVVSVSYLTVTMSYIGKEARKN
jgi:hypothetical protein